MPADRFCGSQELPSIPDVPDGPKRGQARPLICNLCEHDITDHYIHIRNTKPPEFDIVRCKQCGCEKTYTIEECK